MRLGHIFLLVLVVLMGLVLSACEEDNEGPVAVAPETPAEIAETVLDAISDGDVQLAERYLCEKDIAILQANPPTDIYPDFSSVSCGGNETIVTCRYTISINNRSVESGLEAVFDVQEDGSKICAVTE